MVDMFLYIFGIDLKLTQTGIKTNSIPLFNIAIYVFDFHLSVYLIVFDFSISFYVLITNTHAIRVGAFKYNFWIHSICPRIDFCKKAGLSLGASHRAFKVVLTVFVDIPVASAIARCVIIN